MLFFENFTCQRFITHLCVKYIFFLLNLRCTYQCPYIYEEFEYELKCVLCRVYKSSKKINIIGFCHECIFNKEEECKDEAFHIIKNKTGFFESINLRVIN